MGVSIFYETPEEEIVHLSVGWRSMMYELLMDYGLLGILGEAHIEDIKEAAEKQLVGERRKPFDWSQSIHDAFHQMVLAIEKHGYIIMRAEY